MADSDKHAADGESAPETVGRMLRNARDAHDLSIEQISAELRIEAQQLDALEQDRFERIGVPVFVKGYLRQYGARLGLDPRDLLAQYYKQTSLQDVQIQPSKTIKLHDEHQITVWIVAALVLLVLIVAFGVWWLNGGGFGLAVGSAAAPATRSDSAPAAPAPAPATSATPASAPTAPAADAPAPAASAPTPAAERAAGAVAVAGASPSAAGQSAASVAGANRSAEASGSATAVTDAGGGAGADLVVPLEVTFDQASWAEITDSRGERLFYGLGAAGRKAPLRGEPPFKVVLGNSAGVRMSLDGEEYPVPTNGQPGDFARFTVDLSQE